MKTSTSLCSLPDDVLLRVVTLLPVPTILAVRKTCRTLCRITEFKLVWLDVIDRDLLWKRRSVPLSCRSLSQLSAQQTEIVALHALKLQLNMSHQTKPQSVVPFHRTRSVTWLHIVQGKWLLAACSDATVSTITLWSLSSVLSGSCTTPQAEAYLDGPVNDGAVQIQEGRLIVALDVRSPIPYIDAISLCRSADTLTFTREAHLSGMSRLRCLQGPMIGFALWDEVSVPCVVNWKSGVGVKLRETPDIAGGCICMAIQNSMLALVIQRKLEIHSLMDTDTLRFQKTHEMQVESPIGHAQLVFNHHSTDNDFTVIRMCYSIVEGVFVHDVICPVNGDDITMVPTWHYKPDYYEEEFPFDTLRPSFGTDDLYISWFNGPRRIGKHTKFLATSIPMSHATPSTIAPSTRTVPYVLADRDMPALYCMGVRAYDERRGVLVLGNAYGELVLYDFSGTDPHQLEDCFKDLVFPSSECRDILSQTPIISHPVPPFPYSQALLPDTNIRDVMVNSWRPEQPDPVPPGWTINWVSPWEDQERDYPWARFVATIDSIALHMEHVRSFFGTTVPLLRQEDEITIFKAGGLLFVWNEALEEIYVVSPGISLEEFVERFEARGYSDLPISPTTPEGTRSLELQRFTEMWKWERRDHNRNRWQELKNRGGGVHPSWTDPNPPSTYYPMLLN